MKTFQIVNGWCYNDCTERFPSAALTVGKFPSDVLFVNAPDYVFEGWAYDETKEGDARFIKPEAPEGWLYDEMSGTYYPEGEIAPSCQPTDTDVINALLGVIE